MKANRQVHIATVAAIRPDLIRLAPLIKKLDADAKIRHTFIHTGQHFDYNLSEGFLAELGLRQPNYWLAAGGSQLYPRPQEEQLAYLIQQLPKVLSQDFGKPDLTLFLGDSNSVLVAPVLKKLGFAVGHIEAGMRSNDFRMPEEINRRCCDLSADMRFCYHESYVKTLENEGFSQGNFIVGNPIKETFNQFIQPLVRAWGKKTEHYILVDLHRDELIKDPTQLEQVLDYCRKAAKYYNLPILMLKFPRTYKTIKDNNLNDDQITYTDLAPYFEYMELVYHAKFLISDSGTAQEEPCLLKTPVIVPRQYTERSLSMAYECSFLLRRPLGDFKASMAWLDAEPAMDTAWLGDGRTSSKIVSIIKKTLGKS